MEYTKHKEFLELREEAILYMDKLRENAFKQFLRKVGIEDTFAYTYDSGKNKFTIYTSKPGIWIGLHGKNVGILKEILSKELKENCDVEFKEIRGKFMTVNFND